MATKSSPAITESEHAWAAGLFEGEGCFTGSTRRQMILGGRLEAEYFQVQASLSMTDRDIVYRFQRVVECGGIIVRDFKGNLKRQWMWQAQAKRDIKHLRDIFSPWLGERRLARLDELLEIDRATREYRLEEIARVTSEP